VVPVNDPYLPEADFIVMVANGEVPLPGSVMAAENLKLLITYTIDAEVSNRDWATMVLVGHAPDTPKEVRAALLSTTEDADASVRGEALQGLAERDKERAPPLVRHELKRDECAYATFQAARIAADPSLLEGLRAWVGRGGATWIDDEIREAVIACETTNLASE
jgi:HEAT repeat protein